MSRPKKRNRQRDQEANRRRGSRQRESQWSSDQGRNEPEGNVEGI